MTPEGKVKAEVKEYLNLLGSDCWYYMPVPMGYGKRGVPDFVCCIRGQFYGIECKAPGKRSDLTPWQSKELDAIHAAGGCSVVIEAVDGIKKYFNALLG
jgi:hypothetical protein